MIRRIGTALASVSLLAMGALLPLACQDKDSAGDENSENGGASASDEGAGGDVQGGAAGLDGGGKQGTGGDAQASCDQGCAEGKACFEGECVERAWAFRRDIEALKSQISEPIPVVLPEGDAIISVLSPDYSQIGYLSFDWEEATLSEPVWLGPIDGKRVVKFNSKGEGFIAAATEEGVDVYPFDPENGFDEPITATTARAVELDGAMGEDGLAYLAYRTPASMGGGGIYLVTGDISEKELSEPVTVDAGCDDFCDQGPSLALNREGEGVLVWTNVTDVFASHKKSGSWSDRKTVNSLSTYPSQPQVGISEAGEAVIVTLESDLYNSPDAESLIYYGLYDGSVWEEPEALNSEDITALDVQFDSLGGGMLSYAVRDPEAPADDNLSQLVYGAAFDFETQSFGQKKYLGKTDFLLRLGAFRGPDGSGMIISALTDAEEGDQGLAFPYVDSGFEAPFEVASSLNHAGVAWNDRGDAVGLTVENGGTITLFRNLKF